MSRTLFYVVVILALILAPMAIVVETDDDRECETDPITFEALNAAIAQPVTAAPDTTAQGDRASRGERSDVLDVLDQVVACSNDGEPLRVLNLYTPEYIARLYQVQGPVTQEQYDSLAVPQPADPEQGMVLLNAGDVIRIGDGQFTVPVTMSYGSVPEPKDLVVALRQSGDTLLIDEVNGEITFSLP